MKVALLILLFNTNGEPVSFFEPVPAFETMEACVTAFEKEADTLIPSNAEARVLCVSADETVVVR